MKLDSGLSICAAQTYLPRVISSVFTGRHEESLALRNTWRLNTRHSVYLRLFVLSAWRSGLCARSGPKHWRWCQNTKLQGSTVMSEHEGVTAGTCYTHSLHAGLRQIDQPVLGLPGQTRSVLVFGQTWSVFVLAFISSCLGQTRSVLALVSQTLSFPVLFRIDQFLPWSDFISYFSLSWPDSITSCLGQNRSVLVLDRLDHFLSWPDSITSCLGQNLSVLVLVRQNRSVLVLAKRYHFLSWTDSISSCLGQNWSVLVLDRIDQLFSWTDSKMFCLCHTRSVLDQIRSVLDLGRFTQFLENSFLSLPDSISLGQIGSCLYAIRSVLGKLLSLPDLISSWQIRLDQLLTNQFLSLPDSISSCAC